MSQQTWSPQQYEVNGRFVTQLGGAVFDLLSPRPGERILDLGCGDGVLTERIRFSGATVVGVDNSEEMIAAARARGLDARVLDAHALMFESEFDAVFSNAALHWMLDPDAVLSGVHRALRQGGRFVAEFGGKGNIAAIQVAQLAVSAEYAADVRLVTAKYYPTSGEYREKLGQHGFAVDSIALIPRPTVLPTGMAGWLSTFAKGWLNSIEEGRREAARDQVVRLLQPFLCDSAGNWTADYVRIRVAARKL